MRELDWFDGDEQDGRPAGGHRPRRRLLIALAAVPWVIVAAILALPGGGGTQTAGQAGEQPVAPPEGSPDAAAEDGVATGTAPDDTTTAATDPVGDDPAGDDGSTPALLSLEELRGRWRVAPGEEELAALAVVLARAHLTGIGPGIEVDGAAPSPTSYAEHLVVEAVEHPSTDTAVVTVLAVVLIDDAPEEGRVELRRLALPLTRDDPPAIAGSPWELPAPTLPARGAVDLQPIDDPELVAAADTALAVAGLGEQRTTALATAPGWPLVATITDPEGEERSLWLRRHLDGLVVAGSTIAGTHTTEEQP